MKAEDAWALLLGGVITLIAGALLHQVQLGGRRRRRRRDAKEQLELLELLDDHPEVAERVRRRVTAALEAYEPSEETLMRRRGRSITLVSMAIASTIAAVTLVLNGELPGIPVLIAFALSTATGALGIEEALTRRFEGRVEEHAVAQGRGADTPINRPVRRTSR